MAVAKTNPFKLVTGVGRFGFANELHKVNDKGQYQIMFLIPKTDVATINKIKQVVEAFKADPKAQAVWGSKFLASFKTPLRDGDTERDTDEAPEFKGHYFINANSKNKPDLVGTEMVGDQLIKLDPSEIYSGAYGRISISAGAFNVDGNKGIKFYLNNVQKVRDGERIAGGGGNATDDFSEAVEDFLS